VGNPHTVLFVDDFDFDWEQVGADIERHRSFPNQTNVEFVRILSRRRLQLADWERGAGATGSSGTGAAAAVCAAVVLGMAERNCEVVFPGGSLWVEWSEDDDGIRLTGPATFVAEGRYEY
jgi:diaminopimelate epimerase